MRPSSQPDSLALDFVERSGAVKRSLLRFAGGRWKLDTAPESWSSCEELIMNQTALLHGPCREWLAKDVLLGLVENGGAPDNGGALTNTPPHQQHQALEQPFFRRARAIQLGRLGTPALAIHGCRR